MKTKLPIIKRAVKKHDMRQISYSWHQYKNVETPPYGWSEWEEVKDSVKDEFPEIVKAWEEYKRAKKEMNLAIDSLLDNYL